MFPELIRFALVFGLLVAIHMALDRYLRWDRARRLAEEHANGAGQPLSREDYVARGLARYERSWERRLLFGIYLVPVAIAAGVLLLAWGGGAQ